MNEKRISAEKKDNSAIIGAMKIGNALSFGEELLLESYSPALDARLLLEHVLGVEHSYLLGHADDALPKEPLQRYLALVARAESKEPIPYIIGRIPFRYLDLRVTPAVLIPRPETELLVEKALKWAGERTRLHVVDVGTGSGCIAISLATELQQPIVSAVDVSAESLQIAQQNAEHHHAKIAFHCGSLLEPIDKPIDLLVANLPYITDLEWTTLDDAVKWYEPAHALRGGVDGLDFVRQLLQQATTRVRGKGAIFLEIGWQQGTQTKALAAEFFPAATIRLIQDYAGHDRIVAIDLATPPDAPTC